MSTVPAPSPPDVIDVLDGDWDPAAWWSTANLGEAVPGVMTPLNWTFWGPLGERSLRAAFVRFGALEPARADVPEAERERIFGVFCGRLAANVAFLGEMGDRLPGTTGAAVAEQILGALPEDFVSAPTRRRWPHIARRLPVVALRTPQQVRRLRADADGWWRREVGAAGTLDLRGARAQFAGAMGAFRHAMTTHISCVFANVQPVYDQLRVLADGIGEPELIGPLLAGHGSHAELDLVADLWELSRERLELPVFLDRHGYHGPNEGEIASLVWRERPAPVQEVARLYARRSDHEGPEATLARRVQERRAAEQRLLAALPVSRRPVAHLLLGLAARWAPLRGVGKVAFLQTVDVARAAMRRAGELLVAAGAIDEPGDVAFLTVDELLHAPPGRSSAEVVAARREVHARYSGLVVPEAWRGRPDAVPARATGGDRAGTILRGIGACAGVAEGRARVVLDPGFADVEDGEILVAPFTDPSWASVMFASAALVVDIGGALSHAAVVARELGIPCVMGTGDGTRRVRDGDLCRVDGATGTLEILVPSGV